MNKLSEKKLSVSVPGKTILIGEHSVVYGHTAIAMPLPDIHLQLSIEEKQYTTWEDVWEISMFGEDLKLTDHFRTLLTQSFRLAVSQFGKDLNQYIPQKLSIHTEIPLGGGMGGSAAVAASFIRLCEKIFNTPLDIKTEINRANQIDSLFHSGRASGLDVATILAATLIQYNKKDSFKVIDSNSSFYIALVDTNERGDTSKMIEKVSHLIQSNQPDAVNAIQKLNTLANCSIDALHQNDLESLADTLNKAQVCLKDIGVSTDKIELICKRLISHGALAAKLTGAGGGGLVLALFSKNPSFLKQYFPENKIFVTSHQKSLL